ncbi:MAG: (E)-4-hydroxy-3-methylbut-2-enyl-diphosphate synthase [Muribaculaceae bacterium]|nr:(E)-4-hydroxy-3-methylbut-2-enyl-diphosphate synthase [Muribaculaceae bacterium]
MSRYNYSRRKSRAVRVGKIAIGGDNPVRLQSMTNTSTNDVEASVAQARRIYDAGGELVRLTTQGVREAESLGLIKKALREAGCEVPLSADVHFNPKAAFKAAETADKVRINPGNFVDAARTFKKLEFTDEEYAEEIRKISDVLVPFIEVCRQHGVSIRLGVNHGSLSDRIMSRYGDTPAGMVESVMEFLRICRENDFHDIVISIKASNTCVMTETVRLLVKAMDSEDMEYPLHLGVTEAGDAEDGRIKSALGIGALLSEGIGDTIRVSLSEDPEREIPVAMLLRDYIVSREGHKPIPEPSGERGGSREKSRDLLGKIKGFEDRIVSVHADRPDDIFFLCDASMPVKNPEFAGPLIIRSRHQNAPGEIMSYIDRFIDAGYRNPMIVSLRYDDKDIDALRIKAAADFGVLLLNGYASGIEIVDPNFDDDTLAELELAILQAARLRMTKTEYIACPGCGRTLFDLQKTLKDVKAATSGLKGLKIGVMGCIVNGPGEMADADYGYVGAGPGRVSLYKGKELVLKNIPAEEALPELLKLISENSAG